jgi:hypothetical protein
VTARQNIEAVEANNYKNRASLHEVTFLVLGKNVPVSLNRQAAAQRKS